ncbi:unnamed protein product [Durusdinium trenchii]|uniref:Carbohydrate esterase 2 N-terminal domain-containing protein n=2 Tax=Durusdinium trenchii TaxID=1381693 RepID=A0ABP0R9V1_9DINO
MGGGHSRVNAANLPIPPPRCTLIPATDPRLHFRGRHVKKEGCIYFDWPCTSFKLQVASRRVWLRMDGARNYFNILINGILVCVLKTHSDVRDYLMPSPEPASEASYILEVQKRSEAKIGSLTQKPTSVVHLHGIILEDSGSLEELRLEDTQSSVRLEFLGDSETSGFGNLGPSQPGVPGLKSMLTMNVAHQDAMKAWPAVVAEAFDADFHSISWSGAGVLWNAPGCSADANFLGLYSRMLGASEDVKIDHEWRPDAIVSYLGGNDWWSLAQHGDEALIRGFQDFLKHLRELRGPGVIILVLLAAPSSVCACIGSLEDQATFAADMSRCWRAAASAANEGEDPKVFLEVVEPKPPCSLSEAADWGHMGHWSVQGNAKWAAAVIPILQRRLGWTEQLLKMSEDGPSLEGSNGSEV